MSTATIQQYAEQQRVMAFHRGAALADIEALITGECPIHHDAEFLREQIARALAECRANINAEKGRAFKSA